MFDVVNIWFMNFVLFYKFNLNNCITFEMQYSLSEQRNTGIKDHKIFMENFRQPNFRIESAYYRSICNDFCGVYNELILSRVALPTHIQL